MLIVVVAIAIGQSIEIGRIIVGIGGFTWCLYLLLLLLCVCVKCSCVLLSLVECYRLLLCVMSNSLEAGRFHTHSGNPEFPSKPFLELGRVLHSF